MRLGAGAVATARFVGFLLLLLVFLAGLYVLMTNM
ncbi:hypothetical protein BKA01_006571 [Pseudonocardia eucalypti]|nr:hypothetical protein [Pseudonocardia eucalypti]